MFIKIISKDGVEVNLNISQVVSYVKESNVVLVSTGDEIFIKPESMRELHEAAFPVKKTAKPTEADSELNELFDNLHKLVGGKGKAVFTLKREKQLKELLTKHRLTPENLTTAAINIKNDAFLQGDNENNKRYGDVDYLLRPDKAAKWSEEQQKKKESSMF